VFYVGYVREARLYEVLGDGWVKCLVCERFCSVPPSGRGVCGNYVNIEGRLYHSGYGRLSAVESRPIEIKPLFHYWPNSTALTYSNYGCNFYCPWCQNHYLSFTRPSGSEPVVEPFELVELALKYGDEGLSASFNEPTTNFDYIIDATLEARKRNLYSMIVTNMYMSERVLKTLIEAGATASQPTSRVARDWKRALVGIDHYKVFRNAKLALDLGAHVEMVYLVVTNTNDSKECYEWILRNHVDTLGSEVPLHINRYYPAHRWSEPPTPIEKLLEIRDKARELGIQYVYIGNIGSSIYESTYCPNCNKLLIARSHYRVTYFKLDHSGDKYKCPRCSREIPIRGRYIEWKKY